MNASRSRLGLHLLVPMAVMAGAIAAEPVRITVDATQDRLAVSPFLYGKNDFLGSPASPLREDQWQRFRDAGVRMLRMHGGNNGTKYNWRRKLTSHPDWYNNVYGVDWDHAQTGLQRHLPGVQAMWCFQLIGKVAGATAHNFNDWAFNRSQGWSGVGQNLAGGGVVNPAGGGKALTEGSPNLYLTDSDASESTAILDHWTGSAGLGLDRSRFLYWNMDNEPEIWEGTHDDVMPRQLPAEEFMQRYFAYAKKAREKFPEIRLVGPVPANEWQWYQWPGGIRADGRNYPWLEYFIKRIGEEQARTGVRLLDVLDIHHYPGVTRPEDVVQIHRTYFDKTYNSPEANGVKSVNGGWDNSITSEHIFVRCREWLDHYLGPGHGVTFGLSEVGIAVTDPALASVWYASTLGEFMREGVEVFTPWSWQPGMWEVLHLFSRYNHGTSVRARSSDENMVSAYATVDDVSGRLTLVLVNRALTGTRDLDVEVGGRAVRNGPHTTLRLAGLPPAETFVSHTSNALAAGTVGVSGNRFSLVLPPLSITSVLLEGEPSSPPRTDPPRLVNLSVRARSGAGERLMIIGFVVAGDGAKDVLLRGAGPSLARFGVRSPLPDPVMSLHGLQSGLISLNNDWGTDESRIREASSRLGAFALEAGSADAALLATLPPGVYTAQIRDGTGGEGISLGEVYDADASGAARLVNVSARNWTGPGEDGLVAGFVINGGGPRRLLIRAVGPGLVPFGVEGVLADPVLTLYRQGTSLPLHQNNDWGLLAYADEVAGVGRAIGAFELKAGSKDAALLVTLPPGIYTAWVRGAAEASGIALIEVYEVP
jgi:hypothetical protein